jgi:UDP-3-O-[3-hydroxymyristoyl] N-acetylglucosamine deacetylase
MGLHTGQEVKMTLCPAKEGTGIVFERTDLPGNPVIPATIEYVQDTSRSTTIGIGNVRVHTVEHVLAALYAHCIDNVRVKVSSAEPPVGDGSSMPFVDMIESAGVQEQIALLPVVRINKPVYWSKGEIHLVAIPSDEYRVSYTLHYPQSAAIRCQYHSITINQENFKKDIAPCRTFALYDEVSQLMDRGLIKGGSLENAVVIKDDVIFSKEGLRFPDEMARHKILDLVGDLSLVGFPFVAHIIAIRSGHTANTAFAKELFNFITMENG